jgi:hypothetical protein
MIKKYSLEIVLIVLSIFILEGLIQTFFGDYTTDWQFYVGAGILVLFWVFYFIKIRRLKTIVGIGLILGFLNIIEFTYYHLNFAFSWTPPGQIFTIIGFQPIIFFLLIFFLATNSKRVIELIGSITAKRDAEIEESGSHLIQKYRTKLQHEEIGKLKTIIEHPNNYQKEFVLAAQEIINDKKG